MANYEMEEDRLIMVYDLCRLCLEKVGAVDLYEAEDLVKDIFTYTAVKVVKGDNLPPKICTECYKVIHGVRNLKTVAMKTDLYLRSLFIDEMEDETEDNLNAANETSPQSTDITKSVFFTKDDASNIKNGINNKSFTESCESRPSTPQIQIISVRTDIFDPSITMSPARNTSSEDNPPPQVAPKTDQQVPRPIKLEKFTNDLECKVCHKIFETQKKLYLHQRLHYKNITCPLDACGKKFATKGDLEKHIRTHTGERPYQCEICDRSFAQKGTLKAHREALHGGQGYLLGK